MTDTPSQNNDADRNEPLTDVSAGEPEHSGDNRQKLLLLGGAALLMAVFGVVYFVWAQGRESSDLADRQAAAEAKLDEFESGQPVVAEEAPTAAPAAVETEPRLLPGEVLAVNRVPGDDYGRLAIRHVDGTRTLLDRSCMRVHMAADHGVCLSQDSGVVASFSTSFFKANNIEEDIESYASALPSRARISPAGTFSTVTAFVSGNSYADIGAETTTLLTIDQIEGRDLLRSAADFEVDSDNPRYQNFGAQFWGLSFAADEDEVYLTGFYQDHPEIMTGTISDMTLQPTGWLGSCPSLSPDGKTLVYKELNDDGEFQLVAVDLASGEKWELGETRPADDQVEWLDNDTILYALHPEGGDTPVQPEFDIWMLDIAEGSEPVLFLPNADSPAVAR